MQGAAESQWVSRQKFEGSGEGEEHLKQWRDACWSEPRSGADEDKEEAKKDMEKKRTCGVRTVYQRVFVSTSRTHISLFLSIRHRYFHIPTRTRQDGLSVLNNTLKPFL